jgi:hypothetical protein
LLPWPNYLEDNKKMKTQKSEPANVIASLALTAALDKAARERARREGMPLGAWLRRCVAEALQRAD